MALSARLPPRAIHSRILLTTNSASSRSFQARNRRIGAPLPSLVQSFLPMRPLLLPMMALAASRMLPVER